MAQRVDGWRGYGSLSLQASALRNFLEFWNVVCSDAFEPSLTLTAAGGIEAEWYKNAKRYLTVRFGTHEQVFYGLIDGKNIHEGAGQSKTVIAFLRSHQAHPLKWI
jgi:hypothetical protein